MAHFDRIQLLFIRADVSFSLLLTYKMVRAFSLWSVGLSQISLDRLEQIFKSNRIIVLIWIYALIKLLSLEYYREMKSWIVIFDVAEINFKNVVVYYVYFFFFLMCFKFGSLENLKYSFHPWILKTIEEYKWNFYRERLTWFQQHPQKLVDRFEARVTTLRFTCSPKWQVLFVLRLRTLIGTPYI